MRPYNPHRLNEPSHRMRKLRVALAQFDFPVGAVARNEERIAADRRGARPPSCLRHRAVPGARVERLSTGGPAAATELPCRLRSGIGTCMPRAGRRRGRRLAAGRGAVVYNAASVLRDGAIGRPTASVVPNYAVFDERRYFDVDPDRDDCVFEVNGIRVGLVILRGPVVRRAVRGNGRSGAELVLVPNASRRSSATSMHSAMRTHRRARAQVAGARRRCRRRLPQPGRRTGCGRVRRRLGARRPATATCIRPRAPSRTTGWSPTTCGDAQFTPVAWPVEDDEGRDALAWRAIVHGTHDYCTRRTASRRPGSVCPGGIDSGARAGGRGRYTRCTKRHRRAPAVTLHQRPQQ